MALDKNLDENLDENLKNILDYIFIRKGNLRAKTSSEAILATYLVSAKKGSKSGKDSNRGNIASKSYTDYTNKNKNSKFEKFLENIKKEMDKWNISKVKKIFSEFVTHDDVKEYIDNERLTKQSIFSKPNKIKNGKLKSKIKDQFIRYNKFHENVLTGAIKNKIEKYSKDLKHIEEATTEQLTRKQEINILNICNSIYKKHCKDVCYRTLLNRDKDYIDCLYRTKGESSEQTVYRIIVGKKGIFSGKKFSILNAKDIDKELNKKLSNIMTPINKKYKFSKLAEGKTKEKYKYKRDDNTEKNLFSYRYRVYCNKIHISGSVRPLHLAPYIFEKLGYKIKYHGITTESPKYGALGVGSFNAAYEEDNKNKKIKRVIKICMGDRKIILDERKGNKIGCKAFESISNLDTSGKSIRDLFYQNEELVLNKNKEFGLISDVIDNVPSEEKNIWYCIATSEFRSDGDADEFKDTYVKKFNENENEKLIELQAFTKGILQGLVKMHDSGIVHLDIKPANTLKKATGNKSAPYYNYSLTDFGTAVDIEKRKKEILKSGQKWTSDSFRKSISAGTPRYARNMDDLRSITNSEDITTDLICKLDSFAVGTSMCFFYKSIMSGKEEELINKDGKKLQFAWDIAEEHDKGADSCFIEWLPDGDVKDLAKKLMELDLKKRMSCKQALNHPFITKSIK